MDHKNLIKLAERLEKSLTAGIKKMNEKLKHLQFSIHFCSPWINYVEISRIIFYHITIPCHFGT